MNHELKMRLLNAAIDADEITQPDLAAVLSDAIKEIDRLHAVLAQVQSAYVPMIAQIESVVPIMRALDTPTEAMRLAMSSETPYFCRRSIDKRRYEVGIMNNEDWRECTSDDQTVIATYTKEYVAERHYDQLEFKWRYNEMMKAVVPEKNHD
jgi:hypothetical protein